MFPQALHPLQVSIRNGDVVSADHGLHEGALGIDMYTSTPTVHLAWNGLDLELMDGYTFSIDEVRLYPTPSE